MQMKIILILSTTHNSYIRNYIFKVNTVREALCERYEFFVANSLINSTTTEPF